MKRTLYIFCGICWLVFGVALGFLMWPDLAGGALGNSNDIFNILGGVTSASVLFGLIRLVGFIALILLCLGIGLNLLLHGLVPEQPPVDGADLSGKK